MILAAVALASVAVAARGALWLHEARPEPRVVTVAVVEPAPPVVEMHIPVGPEASIPAAYAKPIEVPDPPRAAGTANLHLGPSVAYAVIGTVQAGAAVQVAGRDEAGEWLAIEFPPGSTLQGWLPAGLVEGVDDVQALPLAPVRLLD